MILQYHACFEAIIKIVTGSRVSGQEDKNLTFNLISLLKQDRLEGFGSLGTLDFFAATLKLSCYYSILILVRTFFCMLC